jgi:ribosome-binding factor A
MADGAVAGRDRGGPIIFSVNRKEHQLASAIRHAVQTIIDRGLNDPRVSGLITVTEVRVVDESRLAQIMVSVLPAEKQHLTLKGLESAAGHIRQQIGKAVQGRSLPSIMFKLDESTKKQADVLGAIAKIQAEREQGEKAGGEKPEAE